MRVGNKAGKIALRTLLYLLGLVMMILIYLSFRPQPEGEPVITVEKGLTLLQASYEGWDEKQRSWRLEAAQIFETKDGKNLHFEGIENIEFFQAGERSLSLTAEAAQLEQKENLLTIKQVHGRINEGEFTTTKISVNTKTKKVDCPQKIFFAKAGLKVEADRMEGDLESEEYFFTGDLQVEQKNSRSRGETFRYWAQEDRFEIEGEVEVELEL